jgi:hypothetical protein
MECDIALYIEAGDYHVFCWMEFLMGDSLSGFFLKNLSHCNFTSDL